MKDDIHPDRYQVKLTYTQRKNLRMYLDTHPLVRFIATLDERMSGEYELDREQLLAGVYALRMAMQSDIFEGGRSRRPLMTALKQFEGLLGLESLDDSEEE